MRPAVPLSVQLALTFVGLLTGITAVLTTVAYTTLRTNLETEAERNVVSLTHTREEALAQLFRLRQQRAEGFLASIESVCGEPLGSGRWGWVDDCVRPMVDDFRKVEHASGAVFTYAGRRLRRAGRPVSTELVPPGALAKPIRTAAGAVEYVMKATRGDAALALQFGASEVAGIFEDQSDLGRAGDVFLISPDAQLLTQSRPASLMSIYEATAFANQCRSGDAAVPGSAVRDTKNIQSLRRVSAFGGGCVVARVDYGETVAPANRLRQDLLARAAWFVVVGFVLSLVAARWIAAPVRRLAAFARDLQSGRFDRPIPLTGPLEVRALGKAFNAMGNDLAELVAKEQAARREAESANHSKDDFLATVSHELRTPLTAILGWAQMLQSDRLPVEQVRHGVEVIQRCAFNQKQLIEDLLDVSRIASNRLRISREPVHFSQVVEAALETIRPEAARKQVAIETLLTEPAVVFGDPQRLEQIVWNLAWNAVKFTKPSGRVRVQLTRQDRQVVLTVADTGIGIPSAFLPHVFEWFRQGDRKSQSQSGLGLGLGIVRRLVQLHGGSVRAESRGEGHGATFTVTLPLHTAASDTVPTSPMANTVPASVQCRLDHARVLVVEDDDDTREFVRAALETAGASVSAVATASDARRKMSADLPDVLVSDIRMPEENGYALVRSLRGLGIETPAIALTAYARQEDVAEAHAAGFQVHLAKPIEAERLVEAVAALVQGNTIH